MQYERDKSAVRLVGGLSLGLGVLLMLSTILVSFYELVVSQGRGDLVGGAIAFFIGLIMSSTMMGCGTQLQRRHFYSTDDITSMRMAWTGLLVVMIAGGLTSLWYIQPLTSLAVFIVFLLIMVRPAVIRLSRP